MAGTLVVDLIGIPKAFYFQSADPAIANPSHMRTGIHWIDTTSSPYVWKRRNAANDGWDTLEKIRTDAEFTAAVEALIAATPPEAHGISHQNGGGDEISVAGLSGLLADPQTPLTENVQDVVGAMATDSATIDFTYDDGAGTLTAIVKDASIDAAKLAPASVNAQTGTTYTLQASDNGKVVTCSNASAITVTVPSGLGAGFNCLVVQLGAGQVTFSPSSTTINNRQGHAKIAGQYGVATLVAYVANTFALGGDTAA